MKQNCPQPHPQPQKNDKKHSLDASSDGMVGVSRDRQTWKRVLILSCRFLADGFENRVEITKFVDNFILFQENSNN